MTPRRGGSPPPGSARRGQLARPGMRLRSPGPGDEDLEVWRRGAGFVLAVLNPLAAALVAVLVLATARLEPVRARARWVTASGVVATLVALGTGQLRAYLTPWREVVDTVTGALPSGDVTGAVGRLVAARWEAWLLAQLPAAAAVALLTSGVVLMARRRFTAHWRDTSPAEADPRRVAKALARLDKPPRRPVPPAAGVAELEVTLGVDHTHAQPYRLPAEALRMHTVVVGPTGFGKTTTLMRLTDQLLAAPAARGLRLPHVFIDMKGDPDMVAYLRGLAEETGRGFGLVTVDPATSARWNPLAAGTAGEVKTKLIECEANAADGGFSEPHHRRVAERYLLLACEVLDDLTGQGRQPPQAARPAWRRDLPHLVRLLRPEDLARQLDHLSPALRPRVTGYLAELAADKDLTKSIAGVRQRYALMSEETGGILTDTPGGLDLHTAVHAGDVVLFSLDAMRNAAVARHLGNLALQDLTHVFARLQDQRYRTTTGKLVWVVVDEFSALGGNLLTSLFARARGAGGALALASQDFADFAAVSEAFEQTVATNANIGVFHRQKGTSASDRAEAFGTYQQWEETTQVQEDNSLLGATSVASGVGSLRLVDKFRIHPNKLRSLPQGVAVVGVEHPTSSVTTVAIAAPPATAAPGPPLGHDAARSTGRVHNLLVRAELAPAKQRPTATVPPEDDDWLARPIDDDPT